MNLEYCSNYKYLGYTPNDKNNMSDLIQALKGKVEAAYQAILAISGNRNFKNIQMRTLRELIESSIVAINTYGCEIWNLHKGEIKEINWIMDNILKKGPDDPTEHTKGGPIHRNRVLLDPETISQKQNIMMDHRKKNRPSERLKKVATAEGAQSWKEKIDQIKTMTGITEHDLVGDKYTVKG